METTIPDNTPRNHPCPCGSGKKFKRCHGEHATGVLGQAINLSNDESTADQNNSANANNPFAGFNPDQVDPQWMSSFMQGMQKLPKGQLQRLQSLMKQAMAGKDVSRQLSELQRTLPAGFQELMMQAPTDEALGNVETDAAQKPKRGFLKKLFNK